MTRTFLLMSLRVANLAAKFVLVLFIVKYMELADLGRYALAQSLTGFLPSLFSLGLSFYLAREAVAQSRELNTSNLWQQWQVASLLFMLAAGLSANTAPPWLLFTVGIAWLTQINDEGMQLLINKGQPITASVMHFVRDAGWAIAFMTVASAIPVWRTLEMVLWFWLIGQGLGLVWFLWFTRDWPWRATFSWVRLDFLRQTLPLSWKFWVYKVAEAFNEAVDKWLITFFLGLELMGVYAVFSRIGQSFRILIIQGIFPLYRAEMIETYSARKVAKHRAITLRIMQESMAYSIMVVAITIPLVWFGLPYLDRPELAAEFMLLPPLLSAYFVRILSDCLSNSLYTARNDNAFMYSFLILFGLNALGNFFFIPIMGLMGAVAATILSSVVVGLWRYYYLRKAWQNAASGTSDQWGSDDVTAPRRHRRPKVGL